MLKLLTVVGARPQIIKASAISRVIATQYGDDMRDIMLHTGQHYDADMSEIFFRELGMPEPAYNLQVGSSSHARQTARMMEGIEEVLITEKPDILLVYGDTNSTLAGALAATKLKVPVAHVEAGLRSFRKSMPEEINRILTDQVSSYLFCPTDTAIGNLAKEGFPAPGAKGPYSADLPAVCKGGDVMFDNVLHFSSGANQANEAFFNDLDIIPGEYILATVHRDNNTNHPHRLNAIIKALLGIVEDEKRTVLLPVHPRMRKAIEDHLAPALGKALKSQPGLRIVPPVGYLDMIRLEAHARLIMTDSGGLQKEAFFFRKPCVVLRRETEWVELVACGNSKLADADEEAIRMAYEEMIQYQGAEFPDIFGNGHAAEFICQFLTDNPPATS